MNAIVAVILIFVALALGGVVSWLIFKSFGKSEKKVYEERLLSHNREIESFEKQLTQQREGFENQISGLITKRDELLEDKNQLIASLAHRKSENENLNQRLEEQKTELEKLQERFTKEFENLANKILDEKSTKFTEQNKENIKNILSPLQEKIKSFEEKVEKSEKENIKIHASLEEQLKNLKDQNLKITQEAENLTKALKGDSKMQGNWGELVLEKVLEKSGLEKDREYFVQQSFKTEDGSRLMPDVVIHLPDEKKMIVDSKVSLTAYERFVNEEDEVERDRHLKEHLTSIKRHVDELSAKNYQDLYQMESPNFILLFIPIEPAFAVALNADQSLYSKAFDKNIIIVTPTTLLATLRTIDSLWTNQKQQENAYEIARLAGSLYDKFVNFSDDLIGVGNRMKQAQNEYSNAMNKLVDGRGNMVRTIEKLKVMGAKTQKSLPDKLLERAKENEESKSLSEE